MDKIAFILDWDGVIVDSSDLHRRSWEELGIELGKDLPINHFQLGFGKRNETIIPEILNWSQEKNLIDQWGKRKEEIYRKLGQCNGIKMQKGALQFLQLANKVGMDCAIGTSTEKNNVFLAIEQHELDAFFKAIVSSEDVKHGKPDPEVFLKASKLLETTPNQCVVFEDSAHGIEAAKSGGMKSVALTTSHPEETFRLLEPDLIISDLGAVSIENILSIFT